MFVINLLLNKILCAAFGAWPSRPPPSYPSMSHLNIMKNLGSGLDPLPPFGTMSPISVFFLFEGIPNTTIIVLYPSLLAVGGATRDMCARIIRQDYTGAHFHAEHLCRECSFSII